MFKLTFSRILIITFSILYILSFTALFIARRDYEFIWYVVVLLLFAALIGFTLKKTDFPDWILGGLSIWGFLHMAGGGVIVNENVLYKFILIDLYQGVTSDFVLLKFDQFVHFYGFGITALAIHYLLRRYFPAMSIFVRDSLAVLSSMGLSVINEIVEFLAFIAIANTGVGDIYNLQLDLIFNTIGALVMVIIAEAIIKAKK
jgi:putative membrane protein